MAISVPSALTACSPSGGRNGAMSFWNLWGPAKGAGAAKPSDWFVTMAREWNARNRAKVELTYFSGNTYTNGSTLPTAFLADKGPDIFALSPGDFLRYANGGVLEDLTPYLTREAIDDFVDGALDTRTVDGKIYGLPLSLQPHAFYYGIDAWERSGLSEGDIPRTWDQFLSVAERLTTKKRFGLTLETTPGYLQNFCWYPFMWAGGADAVAPDGTSSAFREPGAVEALRFWQETIQRGVAPRRSLGTGSTDITANLLVDYCGIQHCGPYGASTLRSAAPHFAFGVFKQPVPPGGTYTTDVGGWAFVVNRRGRNPEAAARFVVWALGSMEESCVKRMADWCTVANSDMPPRKSVARLAEQRGYFEDPIMKYFHEEVVPGGRGEPRYPPNVYQPISEAIQACQLSGADPRARADRAADLIEDALATYEGARIF
ncbi:ABC transporter substrate-binding protein [Streptomyces sp. S465]|uniref:ABC transporter substrate-binding protein n=1 Tax=Streptomyces sp. S465 TaxID=2979468 RepID=UPI0022A88667|nr:sugar ABC transporter substrate-binding protein [Streptomyces sp. S465]WAP60077.1 sugar ABC transporter substrate-binding protein [Streptomyces sp. S465]